MLFEGASGVRNVENSVNLRLKGGGRERTFGETKRGSRGVSRRHFPKICQRTGVYKNGNENTETISFFKLNFNPKNLNFINYIQFNYTNQCTYIKISH